MSGFRALWKPVLAFGRVRVDFPGARKTRARENDPMPRAVRSTAFIPRTADGLLARRQCRRLRRGAAAVELAVLLPFLTYLLVGAVDFARVFYYSLTIMNCAREGAIYASTSAANSTNTTGIQSAAVADAAGFSPAPTVSSVTGTDSSSNPIVTVTVSYPFKTITNYPGIPNSVTLVRTVQMRILSP
jgi:Flp pilus assembly protein TadG